MFVRYRLYHAFLLQRPCYSWWHDARGSNMYATCGRHARCACDVLRQPQSSEHIAEYLQLVCFCCTANHYTQKVLLGNPISKRKSELNLCTTRTSTTHKAGFDSGTLLQPFPCGTAASHVDETLPPQRREKNMQHFQHDPKNTVTKIACPRLSLQHDVMVLGFAG